MALAREQVLAIAHLARLDIDEKDVARYADDLSGILALVDQLSAIPVDDVAPMAHPLDMNQRLRSDEVTESDQREALMAAAPETEQGLFLVPKVIE